MEKNHTKCKPDAIDKIISQRLKAKRLMLGMSQKDICEVLNVTVQQVQKYEKATNRISSGKLYKIAQFYKVPLTYFYDESEEKGVNELKIPCKFNEKEISTLIRYFKKITPPSVRKKTIEMIHIMS